MLPDDILEESAAHFPWLDPYWSELISEDKSFHHAMLLSGPQGIGKKHLATNLAKYILCSSPVSDPVCRPCGHCDSCCLFESKTHPDFIWLSPPDDGKQIKVDQIRQLNDFLSKTSLQGNNQVAVLSPADALNQNSANAFLKTLEEPPSDTYIILVHHKLVPILPTIKSRCFQINLTVPNPMICHEWLKGSINGDIDESDIHQALRYTRFRPLVALEFLNNNMSESVSYFLQDLRLLLKQECSVIQVHNKWSKFSKITLLEWFDLWVGDIIRLGCSGDDTFNIQPSASRFFTAVLKRSSMDRIYAFLDDLRSAQLQLKNSTNLNEQLLFENILIRWCNLIRG